MSEQDFDFALGETWTFKLKIEGFTDLIDMVMEWRIGTCAECKLLLTRGAGIEVIGDGGDMEVRVLVSPEQQRAADLKSQVYAHDFFAQKPGEGDSIQLWGSLFARGTLKHACATPAP